MKATRVKVALVSALVGLILLAPSVQGRDRAAARAAFLEARDYHARLQELEPQDRSIRRYQRAIFLYRTVIDHDPTYGGCDDALFAMAELYREMGTRFGRERDLRRAIYYYEFVADQYPLTRHRETARSEAAALRAAAAKARPETSPSPGPSGLARVSEVRYWSNEDYTRVVIQLEREVEFAKHILLDPDRIYFDLQQTYLEPEMEGRRYPVNGLFIKQLRVGQNKPGVVRVVLDFEKINKHTVFALYDPFRIVIDTRGGRSEGQPAPPAPNPVASDGETDGEAELLAASAAPVIPSSNLDGDRSLTRVLGLKVGRVVIDPGHGGKDTGTVGPGGLREKDLVLAVAERLKQMLEDRLGTDVVLTRETDRFVPLEERTAIANQLRADLFISIHANSSRDRRISGVETFFLNFASEQDEREVASRENAGSQRNIRDLEDLLRQIALGDFNEESQDLAHTVQSSLHSQIRLDRSEVANRGVKKAPFIVLINLNMPGILAELDFISNPRVEGYFQTRQGIGRAAEGLYRGIESYLRSLGTALAAESRGTGEAAPPR